ncbi:MAG: WD40 repeat domain-containing protein [Fuerstia sp.]|nr:WD40 repeat domain-containing protein [Fuerstiella sp.]
MAKIGPLDDCTVWRLERHLRFVFCVAVPVTSLLLAGCGGGEDFSKPPAQIQSQLAKAAQDPAAPSADGTEPATDDIATSAASPASDAVSSNGDTSAITATSAEPAAPATAPAPATPKSTDAASGDSAEVMTASGKSADAIAAKKEANSSKSVMGNAGGLLGSLKSDAAKKAEAAAAANPATDADAPQITARFGRMAMSRLQWLELVSQLTRQFFVASTPDGNSLAGSTGERSVEIIDTQLDLRSQTLAPGNRGTLTSANPIHIPVRGLPGIINSLELTNDGQQVLVGTTDGRLLVRSAASTADWDLFARDLFLFQDEHRRTARLSDKALVAIRCLPNDQILTIDANGVCAFWKTDTAVLPATPIMEMTAEQAKAAEAETVVVTPISSFPVSGFEILSITIDEKLQLGAIVSSSEEVYVFRTTTGELIETLKADLFADTQPVCVDFIADGTEILAGLADGRILRRALTGATAVSGINDLGETVDYDLVFIPDVQDQVSSITSIRSIPDSHTIYFGTVDGTVVRFDTTQKRIQQLKKRHAGPVIEFCLTPHGVLSIGGDRQAQLFDPPQTPLSNNPSAEVAFQLPHDETLEETIVDDSVTQNGAATPASRPTRPARTRVAEEAADVDLSLAGIRPADSALALYAHQLRSAGESAKRLELRKQILRHRGENSLADSLGTESAEAPDGPPLRAGETTTQLQFPAGNWSRVLLSISDDGTTVAALHRAAGDQADQQTLAKALSLFDLPTGTALRHWTQPVPGQSFNLNSSHHVLLPTPAATRFWNTTGYADKDLLQPVSATAVSADTNTLVLGRMGMTGMVAPLLTRLNLNDRTETRGMELFEGMITATAFTNAGDRLMVGTRERDQVRLLELDPGTLSIQQEIMREPLEGRIPDNSEDPSQQAKSGTVLIQLSPSDKLMLTWGHYASGSQLRLWRRSKSGWPREDVTVITATEANPDFDAIDQPITFVNGLDSRLAIVTANGLLILNTRKGDVEKMIPIPSVSGHRPPCVFSPDGKWALMGDGEGTVWAASLVSLDSKPLKFEAHNAPIAGLAISRNGRYLATIGEHNRLRAWRIDGFLKR